jgi:hypothetical protein
MILEDLIDKVNSYFNVDITTNSRRREIVMSRAAFYWLALKKTKHTTTLIGSIVNRDHSSVIYSMKNFENWLNNDLHFKNEFERLRKIVFNELTVDELTLEKQRTKYKLLKIANQLLKLELDILKKQLKNKK